MKKTLPVLLIITGLALLIGAGTFWADTLSMDEPPSLGETLRDWLTTIAGLGTSLAGWLALFKKEKPNTPTYGGDHVEGDKIAGDKVMGDKIIHVPLPPELHDTIGFIPPANTATYVHRGQIETEVRDFLKKGNGAGAIVGLHAPGGLGKTDLAKHAAEELQGQFEGVLWVDVGEKTPEQVVADLLVKCGIQLPPGISYEQQKTELQHRLQGCRFLLIFDDVRQKALDGLHDFLPAKPCAALLTSRIQQVRGVNKTFELDHMTPEQAIELMEAVLGKDVVAAEKEAAEKLAARCAFNPLALEIAARRIRQLQGIRKPIARYFELAQARFSELAMHGDARWDMEKVFDISYLDLSETDRARFRALAAFHPTGFAPEATTHVWDVESPEARAVLSRFINLSLVKTVPGAQERYRLHDLLDEYAGQKLHADRAEELEKRNALAEWIAALFSGYFTADRSTVPQVAMERANLLYACEWARGRKDGELLARLTTQARNWFYNLFREDWVYWFAWLEACLQLGVEDKQLKANVLTAIGDVQQFRDDRDAALNSYNAALELFRAVGAKLGEANVLKAIGDVQQFRDDRDAALNSYNAALELFRAVGAKLGEANVYLSLGTIKREGGDISGAYKDFKYALEKYKEIGDLYSQGRALYRLGDCEKDRGNKEHALNFYKTAYDIWQSIRLSDLADQILKPRIDEVF